MPTIHTRIATALAQWQASHEGEDGKPIQPDTMYLGLLDIFELDDVEGMFTIRYKGMRVCCNGKSRGIEIRRIL